MKKVVLLFFSALSLICGCKREEVVRVDYVPTSGETVVVDSEIDESGAFRQTLECFPNELFWGDSLYLASFVENISDAPRRISEFARTTPSEDEGWEIYTDGWELSVTSPLVNGEYRWLKENDPERYDHISCYNRKDSPLEPGQKVAIETSEERRLEFPPLEDLEDPFWKELREKLGTETVVCHIKLQETRHAEIGDPYRSRVEKITRAEFDVPVKIRPQQEMALLDGWYKNTPKEAFPAIREGVKYQQNGQLSSDRRSMIKVSGKRYDPCAFISVGNRKPSAPNNPTTLDGWRELESSLMPSAMRDEVRFTRLRLECYSARNDREARKAESDYVEWLESLPEIQRYFMSKYRCYSPRTKFSKTLSARDISIRKITEQAVPYRLD